MLRALVKFAYRYAPVRAVVHDYGPNVWRVRPTLRKHMTSAARTRRLPGVRTTFYGRPERVRPPRLEPLSQAVPIGHALVSRPYSLRRPWYSVVPRAWLVGSHAAPVTPDGDLLLSPFRFNPRLLLEPHPELEAFIATRGYRNRAGDAEAQVVCSLVHRLDPNYYHWIVELCAQVEALRHYEEATGMRPKVIVRGGGAKFIRPSLAALGYTPDEILDFPADPSPILVETLIVPSLRGNHVCCSPDSLRWLRSAFFAGLGIEPPADPSRRIYIPRQKGAWRYVINHDAVASSLARDGWDILDPSSLTFSDQVRLFSQARVIAGLHGAGLTNMLFAPHAGIVELAGVYGDGLYRNVAHCLDHRYCLLPATQAGENVNVDVDALRRAGDAMTPSRTGEIAHNNLNGRRVAFQ